MASITMVLFGLIGLSMIVSIAFDIGLFIRATLSHKLEKRKKAKQEADAKRLKEEQEQHKYWEQRRINDFYEKIWNEDWTENGKHVDIRDIPQLSFEQWLTFYNAAPKRWNLTKEQYDGQYCIFPKYKKGKDIIYTFWKTPKDLDDFQKWLNEDYEKAKQPFLSRLVQHS